MPEVGKIAMLAGLEEGRVQTWVGAGLFERVTPRTDDWVARAHVLSQLERAAANLRVLPVSVQA